MNTAKVYMNGRSQSIRIPKEYRVNADEVYINKIGDSLVITPLASLAESFDRGAALLTDDFLADGMPGEITVEREPL